MRKNKNLYLTIIVVLIISGLLGFSYYLNNKGIEASKLPKDALRDPVIREAYEYVVENPEFLDYIPCYCNCYRLGHNNIKDCCIGPPCTMCYMEANEWNNHTPGTCDCEGLIAQGKEVCPVFMLQL